MAFNETKRISPHILKADEKAYFSLTAFKDYRSTNPACTAEQLAAALEAMQQARKHETQVEQMLGTARDEACAAEWCFHNAMLDAKLQVIGQYGPSSDEMQALGLKKKSERRRPGRRDATSRTA
ncbi:MAG: hypothetical protein WCC12_12400 [Anaerolineales bacterium]